MKIVLRRIIVLLFVLLLPSVSNAQQNEKAERLAGFARLYGVVRYFHPSDAAQEIDWNRFVQYGVQQLQNSGTTSEYENTLLKLFTPITCELKIGTKTLSTTNSSSGLQGKKLVRWQHLGPGVYNIPGSDAYASQRTNRKSVNAIPAGAFVTMMQSIDAKELRGKTVRLSGFARTENAREKNNAAFWLRVDRIGSKEVGFFDNMDDRRIQKTEWSQYTIEGPVAEDGDKIAFGVMVIGSDIQAGFDDMHLEVRDENGKWVGVSIVDGGFETGKGWVKRGTMPEMATYDLQESSSPEGRHWMKISIPKEIVVEPVDLGEPNYIEPVTIALAEDLSASVPLVLGDDEAKITSDQSVALANLKKEIEQFQDKHDSALFIADVVAMWAVLRHFYPYWDVVNVNWDEKLNTFLQWATSENGTTESHLITLRKILAEIKDGHAGLYDPSIRRAFLPLNIHLVEGKLIVVATNTDQVAVGDVIETINGQPADNWFAEKRELISGSDAWLDYMTASFLESGPKDTSVWCDVEQKNGTHKNIKLSYIENSGPSQTRPPSITKIEPGIWYIDITKSNTDEITSKITELSQAKGVIFDLRGYPTDAGAEILPYLIKAVEHDKWMHVAHLLQPGGNAEGWSSFGWDLEPKTPTITANRVFLTDGEAISYAESVMGYIKDRKLAYIIGSTTAGTNGNVVRIDLPSGLMFFFTGMRVTHHDGVSRFHGLGVEPDQLVKPTIAGIRAGRDELLESAIDYLSKPK